MDFVTLLLSLILAATGIVRDVDPALTQIAQRRAIEIQVEFSHNGQEPGTAEILAWNISPDPIVTGLGQWQASPPHWAILIDPSLPRIGCGVSLGSGGETYMACVFARVPVAASAPAVVSVAPPVVTPFTQALVPLPDTAMGS